MHFLTNTDSFCFFIHRFYFIDNSFYKKYVFDVWKNVYEVENILDNDLDALMSRILYVQAREPSSMYLMLPQLYVKP